MRTANAQLGVLRLDADEHFLAEAVIEALDDAGYLRLPLDEIAGALKDTHGDRSGPRTAAMSDSGFRAAGRGGSQRGRLPCAPVARTGRRRLRVLAQRIVSEHLELLAARRLHRLAQLLETGGPELQRAADCILKLDPRLGARYSDTEAQAVVADVVVRKVGARGRPRSMAAPCPACGCTAYAALFEHHRQKGDAGHEDCLDEARWTVQNAAQRVSIIWMSRTPSWRGKCSFWNTAIWR